MTRQEFVLYPQVIAFVNWAADFLPVIHVQLNITPRGTGRAFRQLGPGVNQSVIGIEQVVANYHWRTCWNQEQQVHFSNDWATTRNSLQELSDWIGQEVNNGTNQGAFEAAMQILRWGGDRNPQVGAARFLGGLPDLRAYLSMARGLLSLHHANTFNLGGVLAMNAMLSKVHALLANDGLPIYDSRVSGAMGALIEIYRRTLEEPWDQIPPMLRFKATDRDARRRVGALGPESIDPGIFNRQQKAVCTQEWTSAKIRLGWLIEAILLRGEENGHPVIDAAIAGNNGMPAKMRAFEAGLFMMGFNINGIQWQQP